MNAIADPPAEVGSLAVRLQLRRTAVPCQCGAEQFGTFDVNHETGVPPYSREWPTIFAIPEGSVEWEDVWKTIHDRTADEFLAEPEVVPLPPPPQAVAARRIIIADDHPGIRLYLECLLTRAGHEVQLAPDGRSALALVQSFPAEVIILDLELPDIDGYEVARQLRTKGFAQLQIISISGYPPEMVAPRSRGAGIDHHLSKPLKTNALHALLSAGHSSLS